MEKKINKNRLGLISIIFGILGLIFYFIGLLFFSFVDNRLYGMLIGFIFGILSIIIGDFARRKEDKFGFYGEIIGFMIIIIGLVILIITTPTTVVVGY